MSELLLVALVIAIMLAGIVMTMGGALYFALALYKLWRDRRSSSDNLPGSGAGEVEP